MARLKKKINKNKKPFQNYFRYKQTTATWLTAVDNISTVCEKTCCMCSCLNAQTSQRRSLEVFVFKSTLVQADSWNHSNILNCKFQDVKRQKRFLTVRKDNWDTLNMLQSTSSDWKMTQASELLCAEFKSDQISTQNTTAMNPVKLKLSYNGVFKEEHLYRFSARP